MSYPGNDGSGRSPEPSASEPPAPYNPYASPTPPPAPPMASPPMSPPPMSPPPPVSPPPPAGPPPGVPPQPTYSAPPAYSGPPQYPTPSYGPPPGQQTTQLQPVPAPPTYDPAAMAAQQYSGPPVSGPYGYLPLASAMPAPPPAKSRASTIVLSILTAVFVVVAAVMGTLFFIKNQDANKLSDQVTQLTSDNKAQGDKLQSTQKDLDSTKRDLKDSDGQVDELTTQKKALADCLKAFYDADDALTASNGVRTAEVNAKIAEFGRLCSAADKYL